MLNSLILSLKFLPKSPDVYIVKIDEQLPSLCQVVEVELKQQAMSVNDGFILPKPYKMLVFVQKPNAKCQAPISF